MLSTRTIIFLISLATLALLHALAIGVKLYWTIWWFDLPMHAFGGVIVALGLYTLSDLRWPLPKSIFRFWWFMAVIIAVAVSWEIFEVWAGVPMESPYVTDTIIDLCLGTLGGGFGYLIGKRLALV